MASIQARTSRGKKYWSIVESRRINGEPRTVILEYLGSAETLLKRLRNERKLNIRSYGINGPKLPLLNIVCVSLSSSLTRNTFGIRWTRFLWKVFLLSKRR